MKTALLVINLDRSTHRWQRTRTQAEALGLTAERVPAIDGKLIPPQTLQQSYSAELNRRTYHSRLSLGEIGCYLSHRAAWRVILDRKLDYAVILEDDAILGSDFAEALEVLPFAGHRWDIIKLGAVKRRPVIRCRALGHLGLCEYSKVPISAFAQAVSRRGALKLLQDGGPIGRPVDVDLQHPWERNLDIFGLEPFPVRVHTDEASEIGAKPPRTLLGENSCVRLYRQRLGFIWQIHTRNFLRHGVVPTLTARNFTTAHPAPRAPKLLAPGLPATS